MRLNGQKQKELKETECRFLLQTIFIIFSYSTNLVTSSLFFLMLSTPGFSLSGSPFFPVAFLLFLFTAWLMVFAQCFGSSYNMGKVEEGETDGERVGQMGVNDRLRQQGGGWRKADYSWSG